MEKKLIELYRDKKMKALAEYTKTRRVEDREKFNKIVREIEEYLKYEKIAI